MGLSSTQVRLLQLTNRKNDIGLELSKLSNSKVALTRDMQKLSRDYNNKVNQKTLKWSNNGGASYVDLSYQNLMRPSTMNLNKPYLITDQSGRIVVDNQYAKYAEMISPNGAPGGDWESVRAQVLADVTGLNQADIETEATLQEQLLLQKQALEAKKAEETDPPTKKDDFEDFLAKMNGVVGKGCKNDAGSSHGIGINELDVDWTEFYDKNTTFNFWEMPTALSSCMGFIDKIYDALKDYIVDPEKFEKACDAMKTTCSSQMNSAGDDFKGNAAFITGYWLDDSGNKNFYINTQMFFDALFGTYQNLSPYAQTDDHSNMEIEFIDIDSNEYSKWKTEHDAWQNEYDNMLNDYETTQENYNALFTTDERNLIKFYDEIFSTIAEKGWVCNNSVTNTDYLNQMFQNNIYTITTVDRNLETDDSGSDCEWESDYYTTIASNCKNIFIVNDTDKQSDALVEFEYQKSLIEAKESRIDTRMKTLETEQSIVSQMMQSLEQVKNDNVERFMNVFG